MLASVNAARDQTGARDKYEKAGKRKCSTGRLKLLA